jgi:thioredoxin 1
VLLDIYGEHCPPCHQLAPTIDRLAAHYEGRAKVLKVEAGSNRELAGDLAVSSVPTVVAFRGGREVGRLVGFRPESAYRKLLEQAGVEG